MYLRQAGTNTTRFRRWKKSEASFPSFGMRQHAAVRRLALPSFRSPKFFDLLLRRMLSDRAEDENADVRTSCNREGGPGLRRLIFTFYGGSRLCQNYCSGGDDQRTVFEHVGHLDRYAGLRAPDGHMASSSEKRSCRNQGHLALAALRNRDIHLTGYPDGVAYVQIAALLAFWWLPAAEPPQEA